MNMRIGKGLVKGTVLLSLVFMAGCGTLEKLVNKDDSQAAFGNFIGVGNESSAQSTVPAAASTETRTITLCFADATGKYLVMEQRSVPRTESLARETVSQWLKGPAGAGSTALALVPANTQLRDIALKDDVATVDLSKEFLQPNPDVSQEVALYGLVNTLTQYSTIKQIKIWIEGKPLSKYGTIDTTVLTNKPELMKDNTGASSQSPSTNTGSGARAPEGSGSGIPPNSSSSPSSINLFDNSTDST